MSAFLYRIITFFLSAIMLISSWIFPGQKDPVYLYFDANPSTGYTWVCEMDPEGIVKIDREYFTQPPADDPIAGAPGTYTYVIVPVADGETTLTFYYMRTWEGQESAADIQTYTFTVTNGKININGPIIG